MTAKVRTPRPTTAEAPTESAGRHSLERQENTAPVCAIACGRQACPWVCPGGAA